MEIERDMPECQPENMDEDEKAYWDNMRKVADFHGGQMDSLMEIVRQQRFEDGPEDERDHKHLWDAMHPI